MSDSSALLLNLHDVAYSEEGGKPVAKDNWSVALRSHDDVVQLVSMYINIESVSQK